MSILPNAPPVLSTFNFARGVRLRVRRLIVSRGALFCTGHILDTLVSPPGACVDTPVSHRVAVRARSAPYGPRSVYAQRGKFGGYSEPKTNQSCTQRKAPAPYEHTEEGSIFARARLTTALRQVLPGPTPPSVRRTRSRRRNPTGGRRTAPCRQSTRPVTACAPSTHVRRLHQPFMPENKKYDPVD